MAPAGAASHDRAGFTVPGTAVAHGADAVAPGRPGRVTQLFQCGERRLRTPDMNRRWMVWESVFAGGDSPGSRSARPPGATGDASQSEAAAGRPGAVSGKTKKALPRPAMTSKTPLCVPSSVATACVYYIRRTLSRGGRKKAFPVSPSSNTPTIPSPEKG